MSQTDQNKTEEKIKSFAHGLGFDLVGVASTKDVELLNHIRRYDQWLEQGHVASMDYLKRHREKKANPDLFLPGARSVVMVGLLYGQESQADNNSAAGADAKVSLYARGNDYHKVLGARLEAFVHGCAAWPEFQNAGFRTFVDTEPVFERFWGWRAGLGWVGKNTVLISRKKGSYFFLGGFMTTKSLEPDSPHADHCGRCTKCIDACPTQALIEPKILDSSKCIAYHTVENKGVIPPDLAARFNGWIVGCDICQEVCPWNEPITVSSHFRETNEFYTATLIEMAQWTEIEYKEKTKNLAISRLKYKMFRRNLLIAVLNSSLSAQDKSELQDILCRN